MVVLPEGEEILDVICGDKDFWVISATHNIAHVKPAKDGAATNLNLVTASGAVYSFLLTEKCGSPPDLKVYVNADPNAPQREAEVLPRRAGRGARAQIDGPRAAATRGRARRPTRPSPPSSSSIPTQLQFVYGTPKYEKPFLVRSIWNDGAVHLHQGRRHRIARALRAEGRQAVARQLPGARAAPTSCRRCWTAATWRSATQRFAFGSRGGEPWPTHLAPRHGTGHATTGRSRAACCRADADLAHGGPRGRHAADHSGHRPARAARNAGTVAAPPRSHRIRTACATIRTGCARWRRGRRWRPQAAQPSAPDAPSPRDDPPAPPPEDPIAADRSVASTRACSRAMSCSAGGRTQSGPTPAAARRRSRRARCRPTARRRRSTTSCDAVVRATGGATRGPGPSGGADGRGHVGSRSRLSRPLLGARHVRLTERIPISAAGRYTRCSKAPSSTRS